MLHVYGSRLLWGQQDTEPFQSEPGVIYHGMVPQHQVTQGMRLANFSINLQIRNEGLPLVGVEALHAGCLMLASPVGGYTDIVDHGRNGFLIPGDHLEETTWQITADLIQYLQKHPGYANYIRKNAQSAIWDWNTMARSWIGHWEWALADLEEAERRLSSELIGSCGECGGQWLPLADGYHCISCGYYSLTP